MFREVDLDDDGWVTFPEFSQWWCERQQASKGKLDAALIEQIRTTWKLHDRDGNDRLDEAEFASVISALAGDWSSPGTAGKAAAADVDSFLQSNGIFVRRKSRFLPLARSHSTLAQDVKDWDAEIQSARERPAHSPTPTRRQCRRHRPHSYKTRARLLVRTCAGF